MNKFFGTLIVFLVLAGNAFSQYPPDTVWHPLLPPEVPQPAYLQAWHDTIDDVNVVCVSDSAAFGYANGTGELLPPYSKVQAWNSDMSKVAVGFNNILNGSDYTYFKSLYGLIPAGGFNDGRWSHTNPNIRYFCNHNSFYKIDIITEQVVNLHSFNVVEARIGPYEGNISANDQYAVVTNAIGTKAFLYDIILDSIISSHTFTSFDWASITPWSDYIAVSNNTTGVVELYDLDFNFVKNLSNNQEHADFAIDANGKKVLVQVSPLSMVRLDSGLVTDLITSALVCGNFSFNPHIGGHISGRNLDMPGWALVSTGLSDTCTNGLGHYYATEIFAIKLDGSGTIRRYGHSHSKFVSVASFSPDGTKVMFTSNWNLHGHNDNNSLAYVVELDDTLTVGLDLAQEVSEITIYPNPSHNYIKVETNVEGLSNLVFYNSIGKKVKQLKIQGKEAIDVSDLQSGVYFIKASTSDQQVYLTKFIKQ